MLIDSRTLPENTVIDTDVCIIGAGAAGITLAREFIGQPFRVCLLESGDFEFDPDTQSLYKGYNVGFDIPLDIMRLRYFGGSTNQWGNYCRPLDDIDFATRDWVPYSGWPFDKSHLDVYYERAQSICRLGPFAYDLKAWETENSPRLPFVSDRVTTSIFQMRLPPTRFGHLYRNEIVQASNMTTLLYANVVNIETNATARTVTRVRVGCLPGNKFWVAAQVFILATGGIENARLLLLSNTVQNVGLGNHNDLVGRFFMSHPMLHAGLFLPSDPLTKTALYDYPYDEHSADEVKIIGHLTISPETQISQKLLNFNTALFRRSISHSSLTSLKRLLKGKYDDFEKDLRNVVADIDGIATAVYWKLVKGVIPIQAFSLSCAIEQSPNPDSRVTLATERDALGQNRVRLDWRLRAIDQRSLRRSLEIIGAELGRAGLGRLRITLDAPDGAWPPIDDGGHHMGTTRMHVSPREGVVDENCRVHGMANLFVAGSSVFPTSGHANPTLTIVALAVRLADHVKRIMT